MACDKLIFFLSRKVKAWLLATNEHLIDSTNLAREAHLSNIHRNRLCNFLLKITGDRETYKNLSTHRITSVIIVFPIII